MSGILYLVVRCRSHCLCGGARGGGWGATVRRGMSCWQFHSDIRLSRELCITLWGALHNILGYFLLYWPLLAFYFGNSLLCKYSTLILCECLVFTFLSLTLCLFLLWIFLLTWWFATCFHWCILLVCEASMESSSWELVGNSVRGWSFLLRPCAHIRDLEL